MIERGAVSDILYNFTETSDFIPAAYYTIPIVSKLNLKMHSNKKLISMLLILLLSIHKCVASDSFYRPLPLYTGSVIELNNKAIWPSRPDPFLRTSSPPPENLITNSIKFDIDQLMNDMPITSTVEEDKFFRAQQKDSWLSTVKIIPDEHHVSAFLNKGIVKRFLFLNVKNGNPLSVTVTPCTSILLWNVKFWSVSENGTFGMPETIKTFRTQRTISFKETHGRRGVYGIEMRAIYRDSYVHLYATSFSDEPLRLTPTMVNEPFDRSSYFPWSNVYDGLNPQLWSSTNKNQKLSNFQSGVVSDFHSAYVTSSRPKISVKRLRGNRLHVKWDTSPVNPHLMNYCIVVNTRRDYTSLCAASGERYGVLPPDLMHVVYYGSETYFGEETSNTWNEPNRYFMDQAVPFSNSTLGVPNNHHHHHRIRHDRNKIKRATSHTHKDIIIGCVGKKTNYILNNLRDGMLYYVNVFVRDMSTNISYPFVRTTMKYRIPRDSPNGLKDAKPTKIKLPITTNNDVRLVRKPTTLRFNLNKPCSKLTMYIMPCGGGSINTAILHGNSTLSESKNVDSLEIISIESPKRGRYFVKITQNLEESQARMVEVYVAKKNKRFPLPKLPVITKISEDESRRTCDSVTIQWWPSPDARDNEYCIFMKEETRKKRIFQFKKPNQCDVERSLKSDPYVSLSLCLQRDLSPDDNMFAQRIVGLLPGKTYVVQLIIRRHNGKSLSYDLHHVKTNDICLES